MSIRRLSQVAINVRDLPRAIGFGDRDLYMAFFADTEGNTCALSEERA